MPRPQPPSLLTARFERTPQRLEIVCQNYRWRRAFLLLWLIPWSFGCGLLLDSVIWNPTFFGLALLSTFLLGWFVTTWIFADGFCYVEFFSLDRRGAQFTSRTLVTLQRHATPLKVLKQFRLHWVPDRKNYPGHYCLEVETLGIPLRFGGRLSEEELRWLVSQLNEQLVELREGNPAPGSESPPCMSTGTPEIVRLGQAPLRPPSDSRWVRINDFEEIRFCQVVEKFSGVGWLLELLFAVALNLSWMGFIAALASGRAMGVAPSWSHYVFLVVFTLLGMCVLGGCIYGLAEPFRRTSWTFGHDEVVLRQKWFGVGGVWTYSIDDLARIKIRRPNSYWWVDEDSEAGRCLRQPYQLVFLDDFDREMFSLKGLTEGEARWMADIALRERPFWFICCATSRQPRAFGNHFGRCDRRSPATDATDL